MSGFQWKDMSSEKWFIIYPHSHEGPYSLNYLKQKIEEKNLDNQVKIWSEGLPNEMTIEAVMQLASPKKITPPKEESITLPPLPIEENIEKKPEPKIEKKVEKTAKKMEKVPELPARRYFSLEVPLSPEDEFDVDDLIEEDLESEESTLEMLEQLEQIERLAQVEPLKTHEEFNPPVVESQIEEASSLEINDEADEYVEQPLPKTNHLKYKLLGCSLGLAVLIIAPLYYLQNSKKQMEFDRPQGMSLKTADRVESYLSFKEWDEPLFFKEFVSEDYTNLWLASSSFHTCQVQAKFKSQKDKLLSLNDENIEFEGTGVLKDHLVNFKKFNFTAGKKIIPGMYDMDIVASNCQWDGPVVSMMNFFQKPEALYKSKMSVILYNQGADEFKDLLDKILRKKLEKSIEEQNQIEMFWQGIQEKLQTLLAITLQIEQHFLDLTHKDFRQFHTNLPLMVREYTKKYGSFLTSFVLANEESFKQMDLANIKGISVRRNYELEISELARQIGASSMKLIEGFQKLKNPRKPQLEGQEAKVKETFAALKKNINQKIIQVSDDRSPSQDEGQQADSPSQN